MREKFLTVLVVASLILSVFNLVLILRTNGINAITNITGPTTTPTAEVYASNVTRLVLTNGYAQRYEYGVTIVNPTTKTVPCVITLTLSNSTDSQSFVLDYGVYPSGRLQIFPVPPKYNFEYCVLQYYGEESYPLYFDYNYTTAQITIFDLLNGAIGQQTLNILTYTSPTTTPTAPPVILYKANVRFYGNGTKIDIDVGNSGTSDTQITQVYFGTSASNMQNQTTVPTLPVPLAAKATARVTIGGSNLWSLGATYYFKVVTSSGQTLPPWAEQAPVA
jgi:hypothetical protein